MAWIKKYINVILLGISIIIYLVFLVVSPIIFTRSNWFGFDFSKTGQIGDTIGGITSPFIGVIAVFITGLAFYAQYRANQIQINALEQQKKQFEEEQKEYRKETELQKFETQFYEMLRLHKENVNEIEIETIDGKTIKGRNAFFEMKKDLENLLILSDEDNNSFKMNYNIFFWGFKEDRKPIRYTNVTDEESEAFLVEFIKSMEKKEEPTNLAKYMHDGEIELSDGSGKVSKLRISKLEGHHSYLGHYYRHLFLIVKFVVNQKEDLISEEEKLNYLRILRAQLSNYEQIMLFYNWLSSYGGDWESSENQFFTKYKMIHNLWHREMYKDDFIKEKLEELIVKYKKNGGSGDFFEMGDDIEDTENK
ncbi:putative phage abortive infection protein [Capnocytophaga canis]|uniref:putative phage abortive infection protein n=1 Tax=Capnocytophaga canis TaxID=1848903 RepID=UPI0015620348|nr:putative phage abortive infection protein [Capnocytophaga canis]